jgi:hypothetical protein
MDKEDPVETHLRFIKGYYNKLAEIKDLTEAYLDYKGTQFVKETTRRDSEDKKKREQPRIKMALNLHNKLTFMTDRLEEIMKHDQEIVDLKDPVKAFQKNELPKDKERG